MIMTPVNFYQPCAGDSRINKGQITGHVGTLCFDTEKELIDYLAQLGDEIEGFYGCHSESRRIIFKT